MMLWHVTPTAVKKLYVKSIIFAFFPKRVNKKKAEVYTSRGGTSALWWLTHLCCTTGKWGSAALPLLLTWYQLPPSELAHTWHDLKNRSLKFGDLEPPLPHPCLLLPWLINHIDFNRQASCAYVLYFLFMMTSEQITFESCYLKPYNADVLFQSFATQCICITLHL